MQYPLHDLGQTLQTTLEFIQRNPHQTLQSDQIQVTITEALNLIEQLAEEDEPTADPSDCKGDRALHR